MCDAVSGSHCQVSSLPWPSSCERQSSKSEPRSSCKAEMHDQRATTRRDRVMSVWGVSILSHLLLTQPVLYQHEAATIPYTWVQKVGRWISTKRTVTSGGMDMFYLTELYLATDLRHSSYSSKTLTRSGLPTAAPNFLSTSIEVSDLPVTLSAQAL